MKYLQRRLAPIFALALLLVMGCTTTVDYRKLDTGIKKYHFAQLSFRDLQNDYIALFPQQTQETQIYLRKKVAPVMHSAKLALDAWGDVITGKEINTGQEGKFNALFDSLSLLLKPYIVKEE